MISACSSTAKLESYKEEIERTHLNLKDQPPLDLEIIEFEIITENNYQEVFDYMKAEGKQPVLFGLNEEEYKKLAENLVRLRNHMLIDKKIIKAYKDYYENDRSK